ncbi:hypothetical protein BH20ACT2_BH20ACT2_03490 [soil metagenome]
MANRRVVMGLWFFPRGGSAQVVRYLVPALADAGWPVALVAGSLGRTGESTHAPTFFAGLDVHAVDYSAAVAAFEAGGSAVTAAVPMHPSYEDRAGAPDVLLASVDPGLSAHLAGVWEEPFTAAGIADATLVHLHHLTPQHDAVQQRWPGVAVLAHLHGTDLKFIETVEERVELAAALGTTLAAMPEVVAGLDGAPGHLDDRQAALLLGTRWPEWRYGEFWTAELRRQAAAADHLIVVSPPDRTTAIDLLRLAPERVSAVPNGVDNERFRRRDLSTDERRSCFRRWLVQDPQGWDEQGAPGAVAYTEDDLDRLAPIDGDATVLIYVGRFTWAKRVPLLVRAFARARARFTRPGSLLIWGGHPGEHEGEHPVTVADEVGHEGIYFAGWRGHDDLPEGLAACDALVMPSVNDSFAQTALEAMAVGLPVIATRSGGFPDMINLDPARPTGWLIPPDDEAALADALTEAVNHPAGLVERAAHAHTHARAELSWSGRVPLVEDAYARAIEHRSRRGR